MLRFFLDSIRAAWVYSCFFDPECCICMSWPLTLSISAVRLTEMLDRAETLLSLLNRLWWLDVILAGEALKGDEDS